MVLRAARLATLLAGVLAIFCVDVASAASAPQKKKAPTPDIRSSSVLILDRRDLSVLYSRKPDVIAPIASITKLMTALVVLDAKQPLDEVIDIAKPDRSSHGKGAGSRLEVGTKLKRSDMLHLALMSSENRAAHSLGRNYPGGAAAFVKTMNVKARALGMTQTRFVDASGLSSANVSTATDLAKLVIAASRNPLIRDYSTSRRHTVKVGKRLLEFHNTNSLLASREWDITVQKTGYISEAGQCLVMQVDLDNRPVIMVLLNSFGKYTRVADARRVRKWVEKNRPPSFSASAKGAAGAGAP